MTLHPLLPFPLVMSRVEVGRGARGVTPEFLAGARHRSARQGAIPLSTNDRPTDDNGAHDISFVQ